MNETEIRIHRTIKRDKGKFRILVRRSCLIWDPNMIHKFLVKAGVFSSQITKEAKRK